jgi:hypothetical protein
MIHSGRIDSAELQNLLLLVYEILFLFPPVRVYTKRHESSTLSAYKIPYKTRVSRPTNDSQPLFHQPV